MEKVYLIYKDFIEIHEEYKFVEGNSILRRMSPIQKSSIEIMAIFQKNKPELYFDIFKSAITPIYFATKYGEIQAVTKTSSCIFNRDFPVSPTAFQNSVHNCAVGYISMIHNLNSPHLVMTCPKNAFQKAFQLALSKIKSGLESSICIIEADESPDYKELRSCAQIQILANSNVIHNLTKINIEEVVDVTVA